MKRLLFVLGLIGVLIGATFGGVAIAEKLSLTPTPTPTDPSPTVTPTPPVPPYILYIEASDPVASEDGPDNGQFRVYTETCLPGGVCADGWIKVTYTVSGTAQEGIDYEELPGFVWAVIGYPIGPTPPPGEPIEYIDIVPIQDALVEGDEYVTVTLSTGQSAQVVIADAPPIPTPTPKPTPKPDKGKSYNWQDRILEKLDGIEERLDDPLTGLAEIKAEVANIESKIEKLEAEMDNISRTETFEGSIEAWKGHEYDYYTFDEIRHISISFYVRGIDGGDDEVLIGSMFGDDEVTTTFSSNGLYTYELNTGGIRIDVWDWTGDTVEVDYYMVTTYSPLECMGEGEAIPVIPNPPQCCKGLDLIPPMAPDIVGIIGICTANCGNGVCDSETESAYNCPEDCGG